MKKIILTLCIMFFAVLSVSAFPDKSYREVKQTLKNYDRALSSQNVERVKSFYDDNYKSSDGFTLDELIQMLEKTYTAYGVMKQKTNVNSITVMDNFAVVQLTDYTSATVHPDKMKKKEKAGKLEGKSVYTLYLKKADNRWKIIYDEILAETTSLKYGIANKIKMELNTPLMIKKGEQYDLSLKIDKPDDIIALASITNEEIKYPSSEHEEKFRKVPTSGYLERIVKANNKNKGEYAIASVGFTKISVNEQETRARIEITGMAYLMKRINMIAMKENNGK